MPPHESCNNIFAFIFVYINCLARDGYDLPTSYTKLDILLEYNAALGLRLGWFGLAYSGISKPSYILTIQTQT